MGKYIVLSILVFSTLGSWLGALLSGGDWFSLISIVGSIVGSFFGVWAGYWLYQNYIG